MATSADKLNQKVKDLLNDLELHSQNEKKQRQRINEQLNIDTIDSANKTQENIEKRPKPLNINLDNEEKDKTVESTFQGTLNEQDRMQQARQFYSDEQSRVISDLIDKKKPDTPVDTGKTNQENIGSNQNNIINNQQTRPANKDENNELTYPSLYPEEVEKIISMDSHDLEGASNNPLNVQRQDSTFTQEKDNDPEPIEDPYLTQNIVGFEESVHKPNINKIELYNNHIAQLEKTTNEVTAMLLNHRYLEYSANLILNSKFLGDVTYLDFSVNQDKIMFFYKQVKVIYDIRYKMLRYLNFIYKEFNIGEIINELIVSNDKVLKIVSENAASYEGAVKVLQYIRQSRILGNELAKYFSIDQQIIEKQTIDKQINLLKDRDFRAKNLIDLESVILNSSDFTSQELSLDGERPTTQSDSELDFSRVVAILKAEAYKNFLLKDREKFDTISQSYGIYI